MNPKTPLAAATIFGVGCLVHGSCNTASFSLLHLLWFWLASSVEGSGCVYGDTFARLPRTQAIAVTIADATRSLQANEKPMTQEQRRAILEQVRSAQDPRSALALLSY